MTLRVLTGPRTEIKSHLYKTGQAAQALRVRVCVGLPLRDSSHQVTKKSDQWGPLYHEKSYYYECSI